MAEIDLISPTTPAYIYGQETNFSACLGDK